MKKDATFADFAKTMMLGGTSGCLAKTLFVDICSCFRPR